MLILLVLTMALLPLSSRTSVVKISDDESGDDHPQIAVDCSGNSYVTWYGWDGHDYEIYWVKVDASGTPGTVQMISTHEDNKREHDFSPQIAVDASGNSYVTWKNMDPDRWEYDIYWVKVDASGTPGTAQKISIFVDTVNNYDSKPQIAVDCSGNSYVTWHGNDGTDNEIYFVGNIVRHPPLLHGVHSSFDVWGDTVDLSIRVANRDLSGKIYNIEIFPACQIPYWDSVEGVEAPEGWSFKKMDNGVRFYTEENPLLTCQLTRFRFRVQGRRISWYIRIHVADSEHEYMGVIVSTRKVIWWLY